MQRVALAAVMGLLGAACASSAPSREPTTSAAPAPPAGEIESGPPDCSRLEGVVSSGVVDLPPGHPCRLDSPGRSVQGDPFKEAIRNLEIRPRRRGAPDRSARQGDTPIAKTTHNLEVRRNGDRVTMVWNDGSAPLLTGQVKDLSDPAPIAGATIVVTGRELVGSRHAISDQEGRFEFEGLAPGFYILSIYYGSRTERLPVELRTGHVTRVTAHIDSSGDVILIPGTPRIVRPVGPGDGSPFRGAGDFPPHPEPARRPGE